MKVCTKTVMERCPYRDYCEPNAVYADDCECDRFNQGCGAEATTNADHIRAMSDEELAWYMAKMLADYTTGLYDGRYVPSDKVVCDMASELLRQLQQPYESEETI